MENSSAVSRHIRLSALRHKAEPAVFLTVFLLLFGCIAHVMGLANMLNTIMNTAYRLLVDTVLYLMAITVLTGAVSGLLTEFGVVRLLDRVLSPLMGPVYGLPGVSALGPLTTYFSDNPAILTLAGDCGFRGCFRTFQMPALVCLGTSFGMGLIVSTFMLSTGGMGTAVIAGNLGAVVGSVVATRLMLRRAGRCLGRDTWCELSPKEDVPPDVPSSGGLRVMGAIMQGGKNGVELGLSIIPGVLIVCTLMFLLTGGPGEEGVYTGAAYEGIGLLPWLGEKLSFLLCPLFGFSSAEAIAVPVTAMGSAGAAIGLVPQLLEQGAANAGDVAVFTAMCMCWSGYLSTQVAVMSSIGCTRFSGRAILYQTIGGLTAGIAAHGIYALLAFIL